jgi:hypothetical protein
VRVVPWNFVAAALPNPDEQAVMRTVFLIAGIQCMPLGGAAGELVLINCVSIARYRSRVAAWQKNRTFAALLAST